MCKWGVSGVPNRLNGFALICHKKATWPESSPPPCLGRVCGTVYAWVPIPSGPRLTKPPST